MTKCSLLFCREISALFYNLTREIALATLNFPILKKLVSCERKLLPVILKGKGSESYENLNKIYSLIEPFTIKVIL